MTESDWLSCLDPTAMLEFARERGVADRKVRLFAVACGRDIWHSLRRRSSRTAVEVGERFADGLAGEDEVVAAWQAVTGYSSPGLGDRFRKFVESRAAGAAACWALARPAFPGLTVERAVQVHPADRRRAATERYCALVRDIVNPFLQALFDPSWLSSSVLALARSMYDSRDFTAMPILADALQDAGCEDAEVLGHCRGDGAHVRGCWVVDGVLGLG